MMSRNYGEKLMNVEDLKKQKENNLNSESDEIKSLENQIYHLNCRMHALHLSQTKIQKEYLYVSQMFYEKIYALAELKLNNPKKIKISEE